MKAAKTILTAVAASLLAGVAQATDENARTESVIVIAQRLAKVPDASIDWAAIADATIDFSTLEISRPRSNEHDQPARAQRVDFARAEDQRAQS